MKSSPEIARAAMWACFLANALASGMVIAAEASAPNSRVATEVSSVVAREPDGRVRQFVDLKGKIFDVRYNPMAQVLSVEATPTPNISDIVLLAYAQTGSLAAARFRSGYTVYFDYRADGTAMVRDSSGVVMVRTQADQRVLESPSPSLPTDLISAVARVERTLASIAKAQR